ncbi:hypothetical protein EW026_g7310 [Hermanssonia centrifuga]|uniref:Uncharacterized protein n=1 Tax=Hermanssonia centrifuga TaxID=98765 RepID=A0A4S4KCS3_9APHY|nr:hypothetical protein EW026_g7310 [Hermanssonia centrifuga]
MARLYKGGEHASARIYSDYVYLQRDDVQELQRFDDIPPFEHLPAPFIPGYRQRLKPPLMYFGWKINVDDWLEYAEQHGCTVMTRIMHFKYEHPPDDDEKDIDEMIAVEEVDKYATALQVFWSFLWELKITPHGHSPLKCCKGVKGPRTIVVLRDNFKGNSSLTSEKLEKLQELMRQSEPPRWYPSSFFHWSYY